MSLSPINLARSVITKKTPGRTFSKLSELTARSESSFCSVVIAAAGSSQRCKGEDKLLYKIDGKPVLMHTIEVFEKCDAIREIVVVVRPELISEIADMCNVSARGVISERNAGSEGDGKIITHGFSKVSKVIAGGETRTQSVSNGVFNVSPKAKFIAIHDGARPCCDNEIIKETLKRATQYHAAAPGVPVISTIKRAAINEKSSCQVIADTVDRTGLYEIQTPQIFKAAIIKAALSNAIKKSIPLTDDCMAVELLGMPVHIVEGDRRNIKITEADDLEIAKMLLSAK